jgi:hypothetical protein
LPVPLTKLLSPLIIVNLSGNGGSITNPSSITTTIDTGKPAQPTFTLVDTGSLNNDGITSNGLIHYQLHRFA